MSELLCKTCQGVVDVHVAMLTGNVSEIVKTRARAAARMMPGIEVEQFAPVARGPNGLYYVQCWVRVNLEEEPK